MDYSELTPMQLDVLQEVGNIGAGNAATALSELLNEKVDMSVPAVNIIPFDDIFSSIDVEVVVIGVVVRVLGDIPGNILFTLEKDVALRIISGLVGKEQQQITEIGNSALCEIGNIISSSFMNAIAELTKLEVRPSVPAVALDMMAAILSTTFIEAGQFDEYVLDLETNFLQENEKIRGHFYYIPMPGSLEKILNSLGVN
ncbi:chemotaxis protein CheC [Clostridium estertheticum]|uniref:CheY-P-specific phosphatase CheC n=2 Tax=Clostridium estertheticum TaxID=238834 RepID=A0A1J0GIH1_9CLOT|nr:chemotaxis protein CheC [Clostridium estertheticum]APC41186.1 CheY-P-specific phosphatase CheC [Clostridium estertheticum subsp. estertheticum]MBU3074198.1 chemotaxis protein CheC [Clostridium estertheticum]MBU3164292.1 chemotaxis protein CheC [Clostridium estertheticum]MPQ32575.1 chemotaxis protein CheC [Clostridium estertheticum]MPQ63234.1 chemotaxis protein CheC [Clostridium estertheticum]